VAFILFGGKHARQIVVTVRKTEGLLQWEITLTLFPLKKDHGSLQLKGRAKERGRESVKEIPGKDLMGGSEGKR